MELQARHGIPPNQVRQPTDCRFTSSCSPPRLATTQLPSITGLRPTQARTFTALAKRPRGRTMPAFAGMTLNSLSYPPILNDSRD